MNREEKNQQRFPQLQQNNIYNQSQEEIPFYVPPDFEIFKLKEKEKERKRQERLEEREKPIWEKGIKTDMAGKLKSLWKQEEVEQDQQIEKQMNIIEAANSAIKNRVKQKESRRVFVEKKREMFLFQKLIDKKRKQINKFEELTRLHEKGLLKAEQMLENDLETFNAYLEKNKMKSRNTIKMAEDETKLKQERIFEIKQKNEQKVDLFTKNAEKLENLQTLHLYKSFLDKITPQDHLKSSIKEIKKEGQENSRKIFENYNIVIDEEFMRVLDESEDENEMYFNKPEKLEIYFETLEEKNLFLISNTKDIEQKIEDVIKKKDKTKEQKDDQISNLLKNKEELQQKMNVLNDQIKKLKVNTNDKETPELLNRLDNEITAQYQTYINESGSVQRREVVGSGVEVLREMEATIDRLIRELLYYKTNARTKGVYEKEEKSCRDNRIDQKKKDNEELKELMDKQAALAEKRNRIVKRQGRPIMKRSMLVKEEIKEEVVPQISQEEYERIRYFT